MTDRNRKPGIIVRAGQALDRIISIYDPVRAVDRAQARKVFGYYEAARTSTLRKQRRETASANTAVGRAGSNLREQARHLEQNHDVARSVLTTLIANTVGAKGIQIEPQPRDRDGNIHDSFAMQILNLRRDWEKKPEVTWQHDWASCSRLLARSFFRDGEVFAQRLLGNINTLDHGTRIPFSLEMLEADMVPMGVDSVTPSVVIRQGVEINGWRRPVAFHVYREHPGDSYVMLKSSDLKRIPANRMLHLKLIDRIGQLRGVSVFASVLGRLDDIKDYEESERIAAKVAASMAAYIKKGSPETYDAEGDEDGDGDPDPRQLKFRPGMVFDDLLPGEDIGTIDTSRPNVNLDKFLSGQVRRVAGGTNTTYSSVSKDYNGTYSAQRQELVEGYGAYQILGAELISAIDRPVYQDMLTAAIASRKLDIPPDLDLSTLDDALFIAPQMPWIDPQKEANAMVTLESAGHASAPEIIRRRGQNPNDVLEQEARWQDKVREKGLHFEPMMSPEPIPEPQEPSNVRQAKFRA